MNKPNYPYRKFLQGVVSTRKFLIRTNRSMKRAPHMDTTIMQAEQLLMRMPAEKTVQEFCKRYYNQVRDLIPASGANDKRIETLNAIINA